MRYLRTARALIPALLLAAHLVAAADVQVQVHLPAGAALKDAVVYLTPVQPVHYPPQKAVIDQVKRRFVPRLSVIQAGTSVDFPNSDNVRHSVYSFSPAKSFTLKIYSGRPAAPVLFDKPGVVVLGCNIHDSMVAWVLVVATPYHTITAGDGVARLEVPPGDYVLRAWHEPMTLEQPGELIKVAAVGESRRVELNPQDPQWAPVPVMPGMPDMPGMSGAPQ